MSDKPSGYGLMLIGSQERPFHVGVNQSEIFATLQHRRGEDGRPMSLHEYSELFSLERLRNNELTPSDFRDFVYSALVSGYQVDNMRPDFSHMLVGHWLDDASPDEAGKPLQELIAQFTKRIERAIERIKNEQAPTKKPAKGRVKKANP
jgi:hypothetical protein